MARPFSLPRPLPSRLRDDKSGIALVEFAISLPVLLTVGLMGIEVANFAIANLRVSQIAMQTADNAARVRDSINEIDVNELFIGAKLTGSAIKFANNGRIILSSLEPKTNDKGQWIRWQRCYGLKKAPSTYGEPTAMEASTLNAMGPAGNQIAAQTGTAVMFVEVVYDYQPIVWNRLLGNRELSYTSAFNVRQRNDQVIKTGGLPTGERSTCNRYYS